MQPDRTSSAATNHRTKNEPDGSVTKWKSYDGGKSWAMDEQAYPARSAAYTTYRNEEDWFVVRSHAELGGRVIVDATKQMAPGMIDLSITSVKGPSAACAIPKAAALALADELRRVGEPDWSVRLARFRHRVLYPMVVVAAAIWLVRQLIA